MPSLTVYHRLQKIDAEGDKLTTRRNALHRLADEVGIAKPAVQNAEQAVGEAIAALYRAAAILRQP